MTYTEMDSLIRGILGIRHDLVGVKINRKGLKANTDKKDRYCCFIHKAFLGETFRMTMDNITCPNALRTFKDTGIESVEARPLKDFNEKPDLVLMLIKPSTHMKLLALSNRLFDIEHQSKGTMAVCNEATALPYTKKISNVTFLCSGSRNFAGFKDEEFVLSLTYEHFEKLYETLKTICSAGALCGCKVTDLPSGIADIIRDAGFDKKTDFYSKFVKDAGAIQLYFDKDSKGELSRIVLSHALKFDDREKMDEFLRRKKAEYPFVLEKRGRWLTIFLNMEPEAFGFDLKTGRELKESIEKGINMVMKFEKS